jgi:hypothetical protein
MEDAARRRFLGVLAGAGVVAAGGGAAAFVANSRDAAAYDAAVEVNWRHSDSFELPLPVAQKDLVGYATLAANSHKTQAWRFRIADRAIFTLPDLARRLASVDPDDHHLFATLGGITENLVRWQRLSGSPRTRLSTRPPINARKARQRGPWLRGRAAI